MSLNERVLRAINQGPEWLAPAMRFFTTATDFMWVKISLGLLLIGMMCWKGRTRLAAVQALLAFPLANEITDLFKHYWPLPRPATELSGLAFWIENSQSPGTASAHSANMAAVAFVFTYQLGWWGAPWIVVAFLTGWSRMFNAAHYPYQVLLGWVCGCLAAFAVIKTWEMILAKRNPVREENVDRFANQEGQA